MFPWESVYHLLSTKSEGLGLIALQLVSKISNLCDHKSPTLQTDRRTDGRHAIPRPRICTKVHCAVKTDTDAHTVHDAPNATQVHTAQYPSRGLGKFRMAFNSSDSDSASVYNYIFKYA